MCVCPCDVEIIGFASSDLDLEFEEWVFDHAAEIWEALEREEGKEFWFVAEIWRVDEVWNAGWNLESGFLDGKEGEGVSFVASVYEGEGEGGKRWYPGECLYGWDHRARNEEGGYVVGIRGFRLKFERLGDRQEVLEEASGVRFLYKGGWIR